MKKAMSILCSIAFLLSGVMMAVTASDSSPGTGYKTMNAATLPNTVITFPSTDVSNVVLPQDLSLDLAKKKGLNASTDKTTVGVDSVTIDSLKKRIAYLEQKRQVTKVKWRKAPVPKPIVKDTIRVPIYYLATQVGNKEGPTGKCISVYEVHKVDEICTGTTISSTDSIK